MILLVLCLVQIEWFNDDVLQTQCCGLGKLHLIHTVYPDKKSLLQPWLFSCMWDVPVIYKLQDFEIVINALVQHCEFCCVSLLLVC